VPERESQLIRCFSCVFPDLPEERIPLASAQSLEAWDSLAAITLAAVVQETFGVEIDLLELPELDSFAAFRAYLDRRAAAGSAS
jgi:acyl carrier protein